MLSLTQAVSRVAARLNKNANDSGVYARIKNHINDACLEKWHGYAWSFRYREYPLVLSPRVTTGTLTATNGSRTVTASGTPFDSSIHVGAWLRFTGDTVQAWYRVLAVGSTSSITIEPAYQGTTGSSKAYELCKTDYLLPLEISDLASVRVTYGGYDIPVSHQMKAQFQYPMATGVPVNASIFNQEQRETSYSTGTVTATAGSATITGSGTSWLANLTPGDAFVMTGDTNTYTVFSVNSDTSLVLYQKVSAGLSGVAYSATRQFGHVLRFQPCPDTAYVIFLKGLRSYSSLIYTGDSNELLARYPHAVVESAIWREAGSSPDPREDSLYQKSEIMWAKAQGEDEQLFPVHNNAPIFDARERY